MRLWDVTEQLMCISVPSAKIDDYVTRVRMYMQIKPVCVCVCKCNSTLSPPTHESCCLTYKSKIGFSNASSASEAADSIEE